MIADYEQIRSGNFSLNSLKKPFENEVYFPESLTFPFAEARFLKIKAMAKEQGKILDARELPEVELLFDQPKSVKDGSSVGYPTEDLSGFKITADRIDTFGGTEGCDACSKFSKQIGLA